MGRWEATHATAPPLLPSCMLRSLRIYNDHAPICVDFEELCGFAQDSLPWLQVAFGGQFPLDCLSERTPQEQDALLSSAAVSLAHARVRHPDKLVQPSALPAEVSAERRRLTASGPAGGAPADGFRVQIAYRRLLPKEDALAVIVTGRLLLTFDPDDLRYHARTIVPGQPALISVPGLVEGPAKPREYYLALRSLGAAAFDELARARAAEAFRGRFLDYDDPRTTEVIKGYILQAVAYELVGDPFCRDPNCRLYNAHHQEEMLHAQLVSGKLCPYHEEILKRGPE